MSERPAEETGRFPYPTDITSCRRSRTGGVLVTGGRALLTFQTGDDDHLLVTERFGQEMTLDHYWHAPDTIAALLTDAGLHGPGVLAQTPGSK